MRTCEREGCDKIVERTRGNKRFCSQACQERAWRDKNPRTTVHNEPLGHEGWITDEITKVEVIRPGHPLWRE